MTITTRRNSADTTDSPDVERVHLKKIVSQLKNNLYNVSVLSEPDLEMITNMDPNSVADITGKDFIEQLKDVSGRLGGGKSNLSWDLSPYSIYMYLMCRKRTKTNKQFIIPNYTQYFSVLYLFTYSKQWMDESKQT